MEPPKTKLVPHEHVPFEKVKDYENNITIHDKDAIDASITEFGYSAVSITVDENYVVIGGHGTKGSLMRLGYPDIPLLGQVIGLTEPQKMALRLALNKIPRNAGFDVTKLEKEVQALNALGYKNLQVMGYNAAELQAMSSRAQAGAEASMKILETNMPKLDMSRVDVRPPKLDTFAKDDWTPGEAEDIPANPPAAYTPPEGQTAEDTSGLAYVVMVSHPDRASAEAWLDSIGRRERFMPGKRILNINLTEVQPEGGEEEDASNSPQP